MADTTTRYGFPYQEDADAPDGPALGQGLAEAIEAALGTIEDAADSRLDAAESSLISLDGRLDTLEGLPHALLVLAGNIGNNSITTVSASSALVNHGAMWTSGANITVPSGQDGVYEAGVVLRYASQASASGVRQARINVDGVEEITFQVPTTTGLNSTNIIVAGTTQLTLVAGKVVTFGAYQNSGGSLALTGNCRGWLRRLR